MPKQKDLGLLVTSEPKWETHIAYIVKKANTLTFMVRNVFADKSAETIPIIYKTLLSPKLEYSGRVWNP